MGAGTGEYEIREFINDTVEMQEQLICSGKLVSGVSRVNNKNFEKRLLKEQSLDVLMCRAVINNSEIDKHIFETIGIYITCYSYARIEGKNVRINTSNLKAVKIDRSNNRLILTTLNSTYTFDVYLWTENEG